VASSTEPSSAQSTPVPTDTGSDATARYIELQKKIAGAEGKAAPTDSEVVVDPQTGRRLQRIPKSPIYYVVKGELINALLHNKTGVPLVKEDDEAYYVDAPPEAKPAPPTPAATPLEEEKLKPILSLPAAESETVTPGPSKVKLKLEEFSEGLPTVGFWRENLALADLDGDGRLEIVSPPPRLSGKGLQVFRLEGEVWKTVPATFDDPEKVGVEYGGVACADMDGDGRVDIVFVQHGRGPAIAFNEGGFRFRVETRGLVQGMSARSVTLGDLNADGKPDIVALSDEAESVKVRTDAEAGDLSAKLPRADGSLRGFDTRAFFSEGDRWRENVDGLAATCYGYAVALNPKPSDKGNPFFVSSCRYLGGLAVIVEYDTKTKAFRKAPLDFAEDYGFHIGVSLGQYKGHPAAFVSYLKASPLSLVRPIGGYGVSVYYRDNGTWKRKRIFKFVGNPVESQGIGVGDLNGDRLDDVVFADDSLHRLRVFFQKKKGEFEELDPALQPIYVNRSACIRIEDVDGDGRKDVVLMYQFSTGEPTRAGGIRYFRNTK
jgi:hypothetical protein